MAQLHFVPNQSLACFAQADQLGIHFFNFFHDTRLEIHLPEGPDYGYSTGEGKYEEIEELEKSPSPTGFEPTTSRLRGVCSTAMLQKCPDYTTT